MSTTSATSTGDPAPSCQASFGNGVWFTYSPAGDGPVTVSTCGSSFDTVLQVYTGTCASLTPLACQDDNGPACTGLQASLTFFGNAGQVYYILAGGYAGASGALQIVAGLANDQCAGAIALTASTYTMSTADATSTGDPAPTCGSSFGKGVWFTFQASADGPVTLSTCGSSFDTVMQVYLGVCLSLSPIACDDDNGPACPGLQASVRFNATAGTTYYALVGGYAQASGTLQMTLLRPTPLVLTCSSNITATAGTTGGAVVYYASSVSGGCGPPPSLIYNPPSGSSFPIGVTTVSCTATDACGAFTNCSFTVTVQPVTPIINVPPQDQLVALGSNATLSVSAAGATPLAYQWRLNGANLPGATNLSLGIPVVTLSDLTNAYDVIVANSFGSVTSTVAHLLLQPYILVQPLTQTVLRGSNVTLYAVAAGAAPMGYQWRFNGAPLSGSLSLSSNYTVFGADWPNSGRYDVVVTNGYGWVTSQVAVLSVRDFTQPTIYPPTSVPTAPCTGPGGAQVYFSVSASDPYDSAPVATCTPASGSVFPIGFSTVTCIATDLLGNASTGYFNVQVTGACDAGYIALNCPSNVLVNLGSQPTAAVDFSANASNLFTGMPYPVYYSLPPGSHFGVGSNLVTCVATRGGASNVCAFSVVVSDVTPPSLQLPPALSVNHVATNALGQAGAYVNFQINAFDNAGVTLSYDHPPGSFFPVGTNLVNITARDPSGNTSSASLQIVVPPISNCGDFNADNWGFENPCLTGWTVQQGSADAFSTSLPVAGDYFTVKRIPALVSQISGTVGGDYWSNLYYPVGQRGSNWICTACQWDGVAVGNHWANVDDLFDDGLQGTLLSKAFVLGNPFITFLIGGGQDDANLRVELLVESQPNVCNGPTTNIAGINYCVYDYRTGDGNELMRREWFWVPGLLNQGLHARIRIIDSSATGHLNVDDFCFQNLAPTNQTVSIGGQLVPAVVPFRGHYYDWDSPVWGFADLHTHPLSCLGFGQRLMHGWPDGAVVSDNPNDLNDISNALSSCNDKNLENDHGGYDFLTHHGDYFRQLLTQMVDRTGLNPHGAGWDGNPFVQFSKWPVFTTIIHQQMWYEWIQRAYNGGLRVMVSLCVNNEMLATAGKGFPNAPLLDFEVGDAQITELKNFVSRHADFMEIAYDPFQLRDIVRRDKLAIIIGSELDDIGDLAWNQSVSTNADSVGKDAVRNAIQHLYDSGVRYIFTVHLSNNKFGGTPVVDDFLNFGNKFQNGQWLDVEAAPPEDDINFWLFPDIQAVAQHLTAGVRTSIAVDIGLLMTQPWAFDVGGFSTSFLSGVDPLFSAVPQGAGSASMAALSPLLIASTCVLADPEDALAGILLVCDVHDPMRTQIEQKYMLPLPGPPENCPRYATSNQVVNFPYAPNGVRNHLGLTDLGKFAVAEMMKRGMMLDVDHMAEHTLEGVLTIATNLPGDFGYPLNSGHNGFRELALERTENFRTPAQLEIIRQLGGMMGVGWENGDVNSFAFFESGQANGPQFSNSQVPDDCAGTSKTFAQSYLYALERLHGGHVSLGTDTDGLILMPGPRFGPQSAFGLGAGISGVRLTNSGPITRVNQVSAQVAEHNGVLYTQRYVNPLMTAFNGNTVDPGSETGHPDKTKGYSYSMAQAQFFAALNIFYFGKDAWAGYDQNTLDNLVSSFQNTLSAATANGNTRHVTAYALGMFHAQHGWSLGQDFFDGDIGTCQQLGACIYNSKFAAQPPDQALQPIVDCDWLGNNCAVNPVKKARYDDLASVWNDYQAIFGRNAPMIRCQTGSYKQWDINFEGVAHYGLMPDFLQDLSNVGLQPQDMSVLFHSAEDFAQMWTKSLRASYAFAPHFTGSVLNPGGNALLISYTTGNDDYFVEQTGNLTDPSSWRPAVISAAATNGFIRTIQVQLNSPVQFYRLHHQ